MQIDKPEAIVPTMVIFSFMAFLPISVTFFSKLDTSALNFSSIVIPPWGIEIKTWQYGIGKPRCFAFCLPVGMSGVSIIQRQNTRVNDVYGLLHRSGFWM